MPPWPQYPNGFPARYWRSASAHQPTAVYRRDTGSDYVVPGTGIVTVASGPRGVEDAGDPRQGGACASAA